MTRDLSTRRAAEDSVRQAEQRLHYLLDAVIDYAIFVLDPDGYVNTWNTGAERVKGYTTDEIVGRHFSIFYTAEDRDAGKPRRIIETVLREGRYEDESWRVRKDGTRFWANVVITALRDGTGTLLGFAKVTRDLSDRRRVEEALRRSEERFRLLVENVGDYAIYVLDLEGRVTTWNLGAERMKGYSPAEILGQSFVRFFPEEDIALGSPETELALARARGRFENEGWRVRKDGSRFWANVVLTALHDSHGVLVGFAKITRDLTARREAEEKERNLVREQTARQVAEEGERKLRASEERFRALSRRLEIVFEGVADGITVQDQSGRLVFANAAAAKMCGFSAGTELIHAAEGDVESRFEILDELGQPFPVQSLPARLVLVGADTKSALVNLRERASRRDRWVVLKASAILDEGGNPELAVNIWHDVTLEHRQKLQAQYLGEATAALGTSLVQEEMLTTLAGVLVPRMGDWCSIYLLVGDTLRDFTVARPDSNHLERARAYRLRYPPDARHAGGVWAVIRSGVSQMFNDVTDEVLTRSTTDPEALAMLRSLGISAALLVPIRHRENVLGAMALVHAEPGRSYDASDRALAEELGRRAGAALENAQLYRAAQDAAKAAEEASRAKDEFLATVSHELRTPLNAILGWSTLLRGRVADPAIRKPIDVIYRNAQAQVKIVEDILDVSRVVTGKLRLDPKPTDLVAVTRDAIEVVRPSADAKGMTIHLTARHDACLLVADPERLQQVVWNLLSNAVKFSDRGGRIDVTVSSEASEVVLAVEDTGHGIEASLLPQVFEAFKQGDSSTTRRVGGLGLGLSLVRHIVELHGGRVSAESDGKGKGATFTVTLPIRAVTPATTQSRSPSGVATELGSPKRASVLSGVRVLVVDDEPDARELVAAVLFGVGAAVETAASATEGLEAFKRFRPDVLVSDVGMPDDDGHSLIGWIRALPNAEGGEIPSLALTAFAREEDRKKALSAGFTTHLGKPVNPHVLVAVVQSLVRVRPRT